MNRSTWAVRIGIGASSLLLASPAAFAQAAAAAPKLDSGDTAFVVTCSLVVLLMTLPGLALYYGGLARTKNVLSVLTQVFAVTSMISVLWAIYGYSLTFVPGGAAQPWLGGLDKAFLRGVTPESLHGTIPELLYFLFLLLFAAITPAIIVGAFAERIRFSAMLVFMAVWFTIDYVPFAHMAWGGGWMFDWGPQDFAGGNVVHVNVGIAALVAAWMTGPRQGWRSAAMAPHNMTMNMTGGSLLWVGWLGFCGGCALLANGFAMLVIVNSMLAASAGAVSWMLIEWRHRGKPSLLGILSGAIAGLVAITPACGYAGPMGSIAIGILVSPCCLWAVEKLKPRMGLDDSFDVFGVHGVGGLVGGVLTTVFAMPALGGVGYAEGRDLGSQMVVQFGALGFGVVFSFATTWLSLKAASLLCGGLRVDAAQEEDGLDLASHGEVGYKLSA